VNIGLLIPTLLGVVGMDAVKQNTREFQTPPRILIPKLVRSRDGWKLKANQRKRKLKSATIRIRDLEASRDTWRARAEAAELQAERSQQQMAKSEQARVDSQVEAEQLRHELKKMSPLVS
jgi:hypothetical protein